MYIALYSMDRMFTGFDGKHDHFPSSFFLFHIHVYNIVNFKLNLSVNLYRFTCMKVYLYTVNMCYT